MATQKYTKQWYKETRQRQSIRSAGKYSVLVVWRREDKQDCDYSRNGSLTSERERESWDKYTQKWLLTCIHRLLTFTAYNLPKKWKWALISLHQHGYAVFRQLPFSGDTGNTAHNAKYQPQPHRTNQSAFSENALHLPERLAVLAYTLNKPRVPGGEKTG